MAASRLSPILRRLARSALPFAALAVGLGFSPAQAQSLTDALAQAYQTNPALEAARAELIAHRRADRVPVGARHAARDAAVEALAEPGMSSWAALPTAPPTQAPINSSGPTTPPGMPIPKLREVANNLVMAIASSNAKPISPASALLIVS